MSEKLNLIPDAIRRRAIVRKAVLRWTIVSALVGVASMGFCAQVWWNARGLRGQVAKAEDDCAEVRRLMADGGQLKRRLRKAKQRERRYSFSVKSHLPKSMLGVLSREARLLKGRLRIDNFDFRETSDTTSVSAENKRRRIVVSLAGFAREDSAISSFIVALRRTNVFANVELKSTGNVGPAADAGRRFQINCVLFVDFNLT